MNDDNDDNDDDFIRLLKPLPLTRSYHIGDIRNNIINDLYNFSQENSQENLNKLRNYERSDLMQVILDNYFIFNQETLRILNSEFDTDKEFANVLYNKDLKYNFFINEILPYLSLDEIRNIRSQLLYNNPLINDLDEIIELSENTDRMRTFSQISNTDSDVNSIIGSFLSPNIDKKIYYSEINSPIIPIPMTSLSPLIKKKSKKKKKKKKSRHNKSLRR